MDISVITLATSACRGDYRARLDLMTRELAALSLDVVLLQDVFATSNGRYNTAAALARCLGMNAAFHPARPAIRHLDGRPIDSHAGLAILTPGLIFRSSRVELPRDCQDGERIVQLAEVVCGQARLLVVNVQLCDRAGTDALRERQFDRVAALIAEADDFECILLGGDFGTDADAIAARLRALDGFSFAEAGDIAPLGRRVDRLFLLDQGAGAPWRFRRARPALDGRDAASGLYAADRTAVLAALGDDGTPGHEHEAPARFAHAAE